MSTQRGSTSRSRPQKHQNKSAFKNALHDTSRRTKMITSLSVDGCCPRCKEVVEWKIKYKKYKPLTIPKKCIKCGEKAVKRAYYVVCQPCAEQQGICAKCTHSKEDIKPFGLSEQELLQQQAQLEQDLKYLPERKRRTFIRNQASGKLTESEDSSATASDVRPPHGDADDSDDPYEDTDSDIGFVGLRPKTKKFTRFAPESSEDDGVAWVEGPNGAESVYPQSEVDARPADVAEVPVTQNPEGHSQNHSDVELAHLTISKNSDGQSDSCVLDADVSGNDTVGDEMDSASGQS